MIVGDMIGAGAGMTKLCKLWENPNPSSSFTPTNPITISGVQNYNLLLISFDNDVTNTNMAGENVLIVPTDGLRYQVTFVKNSDGHIALRTAMVTTDTVTFTNAVLSGTQNNNLLVPLTIWGIA